MILELIHNCGVTPYSSYTVPIVDSNADNIKASLLVCCGLCEGKCLKYHWKGAGVYEIISCHCGIILSSTNTVPNARRQ